MFDNRVVRTQMTYPYSHPFDFTRWTEYPEPFKTIERNKEIKMGCPR